MIDFIYVQTILYIEKDKLLFERTEQLENIFIYFVCNFFKSIYISEIKCVYFVEC